jgi:hypothetical protein
MNYPGNCSSPEQLARYLAWVAENEYALPGLLPVMAVAVELTPALTSEGCLDDIPGFLHPQDGWSVGIFQQQYDGNPDGIVFGWGSYAECVDVEHSLRAFCKEAKRIEDDSPADTPEQLGNWVQAVQRSGYPEAYATKGYPIAKVLLEETITEYPQRNIGFSAEGWALDLETNAWIKTELKDATLYTNKDGWLWKEPDEQAPAAWSWPVANTAPKSSGTYSEMYPTRYNWRSDIEKVARSVVDAFPGEVWANTYHLHPPGWNRETTSIDFWDYQGRGYPIDPAIGQEVFEYIFDDHNPPWIEWCIWWGYIWTASGGWAPFNDDGTGLHMDHSHFTFF